MYICDTILLNTEENTVDERGTLYISIYSYLNPLVHVLSFICYHKLYNFFYHKQCNCISYKPPCICRGNKEDIDIVVCNNYRFTKRDGVSLEVMIRSSRTLWRVLRKPKNGSWYMFLLRAGSCCYVRQYLQTQFTLELHDHQRRASSIASDRCSLTPLFETIVSGQLFFSFLISFSFSLSFSSFFLPCNILQI